MSDDFVARGDLVDISIDTDNQADDAAASALLERLDIEKLVQRTLDAVHITQRVSLTLAISGDAEIRAYNRQYRGQDKPTDVLSFPLLDQPLVEAPAELLWQPPANSGQLEAEDEASESALHTSEDLADEELELLEDEEFEAEETAPIFVTPPELGTNLGDIMISFPTARRQADAANHSLANELLFLLCHGVLHLAGYDDQTEAGYAEMVRLQKTILAEQAQEG